jgi:hypothetical protein
MAEVKNTQRHVLNVKKILKGAGISLLPDTGGFCTCVAPSNGLLLSGYGFRDIFLSKKNLTKMLNHLQKKDAGSEIQIDELNAPKGTR